MGIPDGGGGMKGSAFYMWNVGFVWKCAAAGHTCPRALSTRAGGLRRTTAATIGLSHIDIKIFSTILYNIYTF